VSDLYEYHPTEQIYPDYNSRKISFEEGETDVKDQSKNKPVRPTLSTDIDMCNSVCPQAKIAIDRLHAKFFHKS